MHVPPDVTAIASDDGRVFFDLDNLIMVMSVTQDMRDLSADLIGTEESLAYAKGSRDLIDSLRLSRLSLTDEVAND